MWWKWLIGLGAAGAAAWYYVDTTKSTVIPGISDKDLAAIPPAYRPVP